MSAPAALNNPAAFLDRWRNAGASERANAQQFLIELADLLGVTRPSNTHSDGYSFEFPVKIPKHDGSFGEGRIDLYKRGAFVLEAKQFADPGEEPTPLIVAAEEAGVYQIKKKSGPTRGTGSWDEAMIRAKAQAERYARSLPSDEPSPPFLLVVDVGHSIEVFADFTQAGKAYLPFPDPRSFRIRLADLAQERVRQRLQRIWTDPLSLDPAKVSAAVTREIAGYLAELASSLEKQGHPPRLVAEFLTRCLFCMFAEDVGLLPKDSFRGLLESLRGAPAGFVPKLRTLFAEMQTGTEFSVILNKKLLRFNGGLFEDASVLPLDEIQLGILIKASTMQWSDVEPAIFGTLLERALDPDERHKLGAHYTPRAYVERLVLPTVMEPLRAEWDAVRTAALVHAKAGRLPDARAEIRRFHDQLCGLRVLDPACGSGNFLYVTLEHLKRLEGEVLDAAAAFGENMLLDLETHTVDPHQFLGIEINPRAASLAELVLWIGYLQWHFRTRGNSLPAEPVLKKFQNIECRDAVLAWDGDPVPVTGENGNPVTVWDRRSTKVDPVTGRNVPDETKRVPLLTYPNARPAEWPEADYIVGNPPFLANRKMRAELGDGYVDELNRAYPSVSQPIDFVMYFWMKAGKIVADGDLNASGLVTTSRIRMPQNQSVVVECLGAGTRFSFAIPDHPWEGEDASVRIAMTVLRGQDGAIPEMLIAPDHEKVSVELVGASHGVDIASFRKISGRVIPPDLSPSEDISKLSELKAWDGLCHAGMKPYAETLLISEKLATELFDDLEQRKQFARRYRNGQDIARTPRGILVLDLFGKSEDQIRVEMPSVYQYLLTHTKVERSQERNPRLRKEWWLFEANRQGLRQATVDLDRYIVTVENSPTRYFCFLESDILPDQKLRVIANSDAFVLGVLSTSLHAYFARRAGGRHGVANTPVYNTQCTTAFPFPDCTEDQKSRIRAIAEELDAHRKRVQAQNPTLTLTGMYNVLEALREGRALTAKEQIIHDTGLVSILRQLHDDLDAAVFAAYGWSDLWQMQQDAKTGTIHDFKTGHPAPLPTDPAAAETARSEFQRAWEQELLTRLVALNAQRAAEESQGQIRYLRPEYQKKKDETGNLKPEQSNLQLPTQLATRNPQLSSSPRKKLPWPKSLADRVRLIDETLRTTPGPHTAQTLTKSFARASESDIAEILETLTALGRAQRDGNQFSS